MVDSELSRSTYGVAGVRSRTCWNRTIIHQLLKKKSKGKTTATLLWPLSVRDRTLKAGGRRPVSSKNKKGAARKPTTTCLCVYPAAVGRTVFFAFFSLGVPSFIIVATSSYPTYTSILAAAAAVGQHVWSASSIQREERKKRTSCVGGWILLLAAAALLFYKKSVVVVLASCCSSNLSSSLQRSESVTAVREQ